MKKIFNNQSRKGGIFHIVNDITGKIYVGSSTVLGNQVNTITKSLDAGIYHCKDLQKNYTHYGSEHFTFQVVEVVPEEEFIGELSHEKWKEALHQKEKEAIQAAIASGKQLYNFKNLTSREANVIRMGEINKKPKAKLKLSNCAKKASREKYAYNLVLSNINTKETVHITGSYLYWCEQRGVSKRTIRCLVSDYTKVSNDGWYIISKEKNFAPNRTSRKKKEVVKKKQGRYVGVKLINDKYEVISVKENVREQCRELNINYLSFYNVLAGRQKTVNGWRLLKEI